MSVRVDVRDGESFAPVKLYPEEGKKLVLLVNYHQRRVYLYILDESTPVVEVHKQQPDHVLMQSESYKTKDKHLVTVVSFGRLPPGLPESPMGATLEIG